MAEYRSRLSESELDRRFATRVRPFVFGGYPKPSGRPTLVLLGAQPAAGKSSAAASVTRRHPEGALVPLTGDELRPFHPDYSRVAAEAPLMMPNVTSQASGQWVKRAIDYAERERHSLLLEGVFRDPEMVVGTAERFDRAGFDVEAVGLAVRAEESLLSSVGRYLHPGEGVDVGRWTPLGAHESAYPMIPQTLRACQDSPHLSRITVTDRTGADLYVLERGGDGQWHPDPRHPGVPVEEFAEQHRSRPLEPAQGQAWLAAYWQYSREMLERGDMNSTTAPTFLRLHEHAVRVADAVYAQEKEVPQSADLPRSRAEHDRWQQVHKVVVTAAERGTPNAELPHSPDLFFDAGTEEKRRIVAVLQEAGGMEGAGEAREAVSRARQGMVPPGQRPPQGQAQPGGAADRPRGREQGPDLRR
ncbi:zeta toxin family protein [Nocardiopsis baichengensis]|uniref:zeta toxin family protein n=1 Tax=Nocardiopsis baichengensis TaxID=280240 RepID=UPI00034AB953|nr:zeta toxin family protein [Nocardiopsis baichengensis]